MPYQPDKTADILPLALVLKKYRFTRYMDAAAIPRLKFNPEYTGCFEYLGQHDPDTMLERAVAYCHDTAEIEGDVRLPLKAFFDHVYSHHLQAHHTAIWFSLRVSKPDREFDETHWHFDQDYFTRTDPAAEAEADAPPYKVVATIAGPATWFLKPIHWSYYEKYDRAHGVVSSSMKSCETHEYDIARSVRKREYEHFFDHSYRWKVHDYYENGRLKMDTESAEYAKHMKAHAEEFWWVWRNITRDDLKRHRVNAPSPGEAVRWDVGDQGAVHSEPPFTSHRLVVTVLPGTDAQIREMCERSGKQFGAFQSEVYGQDLKVEHAHISRLFPLLL